MKAENHRQVPAIPVHQWLKGWDRVSFDESEHRAKPQKQFYLFSLPARELRSLSGIARRQARDASPRTEDLGIQRQHDPERSEEIGRFVEYGYPWSTLGQAKRDSAEFHSLRKPGWLPTAVVLNDLCDGHERYGNTVASQDVVTIVESECGPRINLPYEKWTKKWKPSQLPPFEIIDGQHRLWAFDEADDLEGFELPVVAFVGLDISWQAYLFWTINIKPKRINPSLAFDLYPLLRSEEWLEQAETHVVYRETRAQELTELLWSLPQSPWYDRINMLGEKKNRWVTQSAWIKSLAASFVRSWDRRSGFSGGLFGGRSKKGEDVLGWSRAQQAAFLVYSWDQFRSVVAETTEDWAKALRTPPSIDGEPVPRPEDVPTTFDLAFYSPHSLITTDQGVRGFLQVLNDMFYVRAPQLKLNQWRPDEKSEADPMSSVETELASLKKQAFVSFIQEICTALCTFDWRTSAAPAISDELRRKKLVFRGSSGYKELRVQLLEHLSSRDGDVGGTAQKLLERV